MTRALWRFVVLLIVAAVVLVATVSVGVSAWTDTLKRHPTPAPTIVQTAPTR